MGLKSYPSSRVAVIHGSSLNEDYKTKVLKSLSAFEISFVEKNMARRTNFKFFK